jgi:hypothetical protein
MFKVRAVAAIAIATAIAFALPARAGDEDWRKIGQKKLQPGHHEISVHVGAEDGLYRWVKFGAEGGKVDLKKVTVKLTAGDDKVFDTFGVIGPKNDSRALPVSTVTKTLINRVVVEYEVKNDEKDVKLTVWGRRDKD